MLALFVSIFIPITVFSSCQYFQFPSSDGSFGFGPAVPCGVCFEAQGSDGQIPPTTYHVSYNFHCHTGNKVSINGYSQSKCKGEATSPQNPFNAYSHSSGGVCDHVTFRSYLAKRGDEGKSCIKEDQAGYFEFAFVTQCWTSLFKPQFSAKLDCSNTEYFTLTGYNDSNCGGHVIGNMTAKIYAGCQAVNVSSSLIPKNISNLLPFPIPAFSSNETYFEITECGAGGLPLWAIILIAVASVLCFCGCVGVAVWFCCCQKRKPLKTGYIQTYV